MSTNKTLSRMISDATATGVALLTAASAAAARAALEIESGETINNDNWSGTDLAVVNGGTGASIAADARTNLGLGTIATQAASAVAITGGTIVGITDLAVADGGTGASTAAGAATNLGLGTGDSPQFTGINVGHATDTTLARASAGNLSVEGNLLYRVGGTDVAVADGGTGASTAGDARTNLGLDTMATQAAGAVAITGGSIAGITDLAVADGGTGASTAGDARTNLGLGTIAVQAADSVAITGGSVTGITDITVADGGTGRSSHTAYAVLCGGTTATAAQQSIAGVGTAGQVLTSNGAGALPTFQAGGALTRATEQATTSGTSVDFTSIPAGVNEILVLLEGVSLDGAGELLVQLGDAGGIETTGYASASAGVTSTAGFVIAASAANANSGVMALYRQTGNVWAGTHSMGDAAGFGGGGTKELSGELTQIRFTVTADDFDAGAVNILYR